MSYILYDTDGGGSHAGPPRRLENADATKHWLRHFSNSLILSRIGQVSTDAREKIQASKELVVCARKMRFWERHPRYPPQTAQNEAQALRRAWAQSTGDKK